MQNLQLLEKSVLITVKIRNRLTRRIEEATKETRALNNFLAAEIDDQTLFLNTGWKSLGQRRPATPSARLRNNAIDYYRSLLSLRAQSQLVINLLTETVEFSNFDLIQPLRERFKAALDSCERLIMRIEDNDLRNSIRGNYNLIKKIGLGDKTAGVQDDAAQELFNLMEIVFREGQKQSTYLAGNNNIVGVLSLQTEKLIEKIQNASKDTSELFAQSIMNRRNQFFGLNFISVVLAVLVAHFLIRKNLIGRIKNLSRTMLTLSQGNLKTPLAISGNDEITDMGKSLEVFRQHAYEAQKLELVEKLAEEVHEKNAELESAIVKLKKAQRQMIMQEKLASLGQLTSGIAHEIKNPLNFITNFSLISKDLLEDISRGDSRGRGNS